ncbi:DUF4013 domain-containing protein [Haloarcula amylovorans]|uniref:DUF4013 domain-containing protein n=1 Tax=Haloarcula amylovorans TaxID=2562280 RepID=UPI0010765FBF|nr:DUF4013 domain-containing protein [Halomicroarcula amylolytica]
MISDAITYPIEGEQTAEILVIGGVLSLVSGLLAAAITFIGALTLGLGFILLPLAFVPLLGILGYYVRILESTVSGRPEPPAFDDIGGAFKDGLFAAAIGVVYYLIPGVLFVVVALFGGLLGGALGNEGGAIGGVLVFLGGGIAILLTIALTYVYPAALTRYGVTDNVGAAFSFSDLAETILSVDYLVAWLFGFVILAVGGAISGAISLIPLLGWIVAPVVQFLFAMMAYRAFGLAYNAGNSGISAGPETTAA